MDTQTAFDIVLNHLWLQNAPAYDNNSQRCWYRHGETGTRCAIGCLIPDQLYVPSMEGRGVHELLVVFPKIKELPAIKALDVGHDLPLYGALQQMHDDLAAGDPKVFRAYLCLYAEALAHDYGLTVNLPKE
jgi:hypothetical protein